MRTLMRSRAWALTLAVGGTVLTPSTLPGQETAARDDAECAAITATLRHDVAALHRGTAASVLDCPDRGPQLLAELWAAPPADSATLSRLAGLSGRFQDSRLFTAVARAAQRADMPAISRLHALGSLVELMHPCLAVAVVRTNVDEHSTRLTVMLGNVDHTGTSRGSQPLQSSAWADGLTVLRQMKADYSNGDVRAAAEKLHKLLVGGVPCP